MRCNCERSKLLQSSRLLLLALFFCGAATIARAQDVQETETLNRGRIVMSLVGAFSHAGSELRNSSLYADVEFGLTDRLLFSVAGSTSVSTRAARKLDDISIRACYRFANESRRKPAFAIATTIQRQTLLKGTGISSYEAQVALIVQKALAGMSFYSQFGYTTRNQPFEGFGVKREIGERLTVSGNYSYQHGRVFGEPANLTANPRATSTVLYATAYFAASDRVGLTAAVGRSFPSDSASGGFTRFANFGVGFALKR